MADVYEAGANPCDDALEEVTGVAGEHRETVADLKSRVFGHNLAVHHRIDQLQREAEAEHARLERIKGRRIKRMPLDTSLYDRLLIDEPDLPRPVDLDDQIAALTDARQKLEAALHEASATVEQAYTAFLTGMPGYAFNPDEGENDDQAR